ncbi:hypothetical protein V7S43_003576 [Phytophthora oleae]|uniref:Uncharacterized protein n=1 Tax=Phytophthora oleae TaxID=2107226 RepID=A0ABD3G181_9STRA
MMLVLGLPLDVPIDASLVLTLVTLLIESPIELMLDVPFKEIPELHVLIEEVLVLPPDVPSEVMDVLVEGALRLTLVVLIKEVPAMLPSAVTRPAIQSTAQTLSFALMVGHHHLPPQLEPAKQQLFQCEM